MKKHFSIAIDGPGGAGKSTLAKAVAKKLNILHVDTGAIYRTIGLSARRAGADPKDEAAGTGCQGRSADRVAAERNSDRHGI